MKEQINLEADFVANETYPEAQLGKMGKTAMKILRQVIYFERTLPRWLLGTKY